MHRQQRHCVRWCKAGRVIFELFEEDAFGGDFGANITVGGARNPEASRAAGADAGESRARRGKNIYHQIGSDAGGSTHFKNAFFPFEIAVGTTSGITLGGGRQGLIEASLTVFMVASRRFLR